MTNTSDENVIQLDPPYLQAIADAVDQFTFGDLISHDWLTRAFEIEYPNRGSRSEFERAQFAFLEAMDGFRQNLLEKHCMALQNVRGQGYRIVPAHEQTAMAMAQLRREVGSEIRKAAALLTYVQTNLLNDSQIQENTEAKGKLAAVQAFSRKRLAL